MEMCRGSRTDAGFTLIEVLLAMALTAIACGVVATLYSSAMRHAMRARETSQAASLAAARLEELAALRYEFDESTGAPLTDEVTTLAMTPASSGGRGLLASPASALAENVEGYVDYLDVHGQRLGTGPSPPPATLFVRRWRVTPVAADPANAVTLQVLVTVVQAAASRQVADRVGNRLHEVVLTTVRARQGRRS